jgi:hypothetical protein
MELFHQRIIYHIKGPATHHQGGLYGPVAAASSSTYLVKRKLGKGSSVQRWLCASSGFGAGPAKEAWYHCRLAGHSALPLGGSMTLLSGWVKARTRLRSAASRREHNLKCLFSAGCADSTQFALEGCATSATTPGFSMEHLSCAAAGTVDNV